MRVLVLGAGGIGGYFGGRLLQAGVDVRFLVRERRAAQLAVQGLVVKSPHGDFTLPAPTLTDPEAATQPSFDAVLLTCKAYDLDSAIESIRPHVGPQTVIVPMLNGLLHIERLQQSFGPSRVAGGTCAIPATLSAEGEVRQLAPFHRITFGLLPDTDPAALGTLQTLRDAYARTPVEVELSEQMTLAMWEKFIGLCSLAAMTCLMRSAVGDILAADEGRGLMQEALDTCAAVARASGHTPRAAALAALSRMALDPQSTVTASMLRDLEGGHRVEAAHIVGDMVQRARAVGVAPGIIGVAWCHLQAVARRRKREAG